MKADKVQFKELIPKYEYFLFDCDGVMVILLLAIVARNPSHALRP